MTGDIERYRDALTRAIAWLARGEPVPAELERELAAAEASAIARGAPIERLDDLALRELALRGVRGRRR